MMLVSEAPTVDEEAADSPAEDEPPAEQALALDAENVEGATAGRSAGDDGEAVDADAEQAPIKEAESTGGKGSTARPEARSEQVTPQAGSETVSPILHEPGRARRHGEAEAFWWL